MTARLIEIKQSDLNPALRALSDAGATTAYADWIRKGKNAEFLVRALRALSDAGATTDHADWIRKGKNAELLVRALRALSDAGVTLANMDWVCKGENAELLVRFMNERMPSCRFEQTVEEQLRRLREQNELGGWGIEESVFARLEETAPEWPDGRDAYRSFRIRFGEGRDGMIGTFERHIAAIKRVHDEFWRWELILSGVHPDRLSGEPVDRLRLLNGNESHMPVIEWIIIPDLSAHRKHTSITAVRSPKSIADEGLVLAWLVPDRVHAIDHEEWLGFFLAGYELNISQYGSEPWQGVPHVRHASPAAGLDADWSSNASSGSSVPSVG